MEITINNQPQEVPDLTTIQTLLELLEIETARGMAVALNKKVVPKHQWQATSLNPRDDVLLIRASRGG
jgi:sulfur carrier protein